MSRRGRQVADDDSGDDWDEGFFESPSGESFEGGDADVDVVECPHCGKDMIDAAARCPGCGEYVASSEFAANRRPPWIVATAILCLFVIYCSLFGWPF